MKALTLAVVLLTSSAALAQQAPVPAAPANKGVAPTQQQAAPAPQGFAGGQESDFTRRPPPPGRPNPGPSQPMRNMVVVDRDSLARRLDRLEELLEDARDNKGRDSGRAKLSRALDELDDLKEYLADAAPYGTGLPPPSQPSYPPPPPVVQPIPNGEFQRLTAAMARESFAKDKMRVLTSVTPREHFLVSHVITVLNQFPFSQDKLEVVRVMKPTLLDMQNSYQLYNAFTFSADKKRLQEILDN